ncbi:MAG: tetratricopeptide repeat protein, partial [Bryobacteraceae bacterium]
GRIYYERGAYADAVRSLVRAVELSPRAFTLHQSLGLAYEAVNDVDSARTHLTRALKLNESAAQPDVWPYINFAAFQNRRGRHQEALVYARRAVAVMPRSEVAHFQAAKAYCGLRRWSECKRELQLAIEIDPDNPEFFYLLATAQRRLGENELSRSSLDRFEQLKAREAIVPQEAMKRVPE